jgi:UDP-glucose 4-epimerase
MKILVFGGSGFLGCHVVDALMAKGYEVHIADLLPPKHGTEDYNYHHCDILQRDSINALFASHDFKAVYNFAGMADIDKAALNPLDTMKLNVLGNMHILESCRDSSVERYIFASSAYASSLRGSFYGISKLTSEKIVEEYGVRFNLGFTVIRYGSLYGERANKQNGIYKLLRQAIERKRIDFQGDGQEVREFIHVRDAARLSVHVLEEDEYLNQHLILTGVEKHCYSELLYMIKEIFNDSIEIQFHKGRQKGHYRVTPYSFRPCTARKLVANPYVDMGQGIVDCLDEMVGDYENEEANLAKTSTIDNPNPKFSS